MWSNFIKEHRVLILMLLLALVMGLVFIYLVPPWGHYDEPTQFEYTWLIANHPGLPDVGEYDQSMRREVAASMIEHDFFRDLGFQPNLLSATEEIWIGISQVGSKPFYYWAAALPLRLIQATDITFQLTVARLFSLLFYLMTIAAAYGLAAELTPAKHPLRWLLPLSILLLPSFVDIMTAVNDDVGATALFSLFLWVGVRLLNRGFNWLRIFILITLALLCFYTKSTVMIAVVLALIPLLFSVLHGRKKRFVWLAVAAGIIAIFFVVFDFSYPRNWYPEGSNAASNLVIEKGAPAGNRVFAIEMTPGTPTTRTSQLIPPNETVRFEKTAYTVGAWIWADHPATVRTPTLHITDRNVFRQVEVGLEPQFFAFTETVGAQVRPYKISLFPGSSANEELLTVYYDGIILTEGKWEGAVPQFDDDSAAGGLWAGREFTNLVRNPSVENSGLTLRSWVEKASLKIVPGNPNLILGLLQDPTPLVSYYKSTIRLLLHTFWARFGWAQVTLVGCRPYLILGLFSLAGIFGSVAAFLRNRNRIRWDQFFFLGLAVIVLWGSALLRGVTSFMDGGYFFPVARYAYPAIIPTMLVLNIGWLEIIHIIEKHLKFPQKVQLWVLIALFILLDLLSIYSIYNFYIQ